MIQRELHGVAAMQHRLARILAETAPAAGEGLYRSGNDVMGESVRLVPVDTGLLRSTSHVTRPEQQGPQIVVQLSYGGHGTADYAVPVHFRTDVNHPIGQAFYLQQPLYAAPAAIVQQLATSLRVAWSR